MNQEEGANTYSTRAEHEVLSSIFLCRTPEAGREVLDTALSILRPGDFYHSTLRDILNAMMSLAKKSAPFDATLLMEEMKSQGRWKEGQSVQWLGSLLESYGHSGNVEHYARVVAEKATLRKMIDVAHMIAAKGAEPLLDLEEYIAESTQKLQSVMERTDSREPMLVGALAEQSYEDVVRLREHKRDILGLQTGLSELDRATMGMCDGELIVVAARPSMGKTALVMQFAWHASAHNGLPAAVFSLEMTKEGLMKRLFALESNIELSKIRSGNLSNMELGQIANASQVIGNAPMLIDDQCALTPIQILTRCRRIKRRYGLSLVVIDYLQLMNPGVRLGSREQEIAYMSRSMKDLAKEMQCPVVLLSQLNRECEKRNDKRPQMSDLKESGAIEADADVIEFLYRDEYYNPKTTQDKGICEVGIAKNRNGPPGIVIKLRFDMAKMRFSNGPL